MMIDIANGSSFKTVPVELAGPVPRKVRLNLSDGGVRFMSMIVLCCFVGGSIALGWNCYHDIGQFQSRATLRANHSESVGEVTGFSYGRYSPTNVYYTFTANGTIYSGEATEPFNGVTGAPLNKGGEIPIRFLPSNPAINHPDGWEWSPGWFYLAGEAFFIALGAAVLVVLLRDRKLARHGKAVAGLVVSCVRKDPSFRVEYEFRTEDGASMRGKSESTDEYGSGAKVWILYLPRKPDRNQIYPMAYHSVVE